MEFIYMYLYMCDHDDVVQQTRVFLKEMFALHDIWRIFHWPIIYNLINIDKSLIFPLSEKIPHFIFI